MGFYNLLQGAGTMYEKLKQTGIAILVLVIGASDFVRASEMSIAEHQFALGYYSYLMKDYASCADSFFSALSNPEPLQSKARLYLSFCQVRLQMKDLAAFHLNQVNRNHLSTQEKSIASNLEAGLRNELEKLHAPVWMLMPYVGAGAFSSAEPNRDTSQFYGIDAELFKEALHYKVSIESLSIKAKPGASDYSQVQWAAGLGLNLSSASYRARMVGVSSANTTFDGIKVYGLGASVGIFENQNRLSLDGYYSKYPGSSLGSLNVKQLTLSSAQTIAYGSDWTLAGQLSATWISPSSTLTQDPSSAFTLKKNYFHYAADLIFYKGMMQFSIGYNFGKEIFGVRNDAAIVYSALEEHQSGITAGVQYQFNPDFSMRLGYSRENFIVGSGASLVNAAVNSVNLLGTFVF